MFKITYLTHMRLPTEKAYGVQMVNTVNALSDNGVSVSVFSTKHDNPITDSIYEYYGVAQESFSYKELPSITYFRNTRVGFWVNMLSFSVSAFFFLLRNRQDVIFSREPFPIIFLGLFNFKTVYEMHDFPQKSLWFHKLLCRSVSHVLVTNAWAKKNIAEKFDLPDEKVLLVPNGFNEKRFTGSLKKNEARELLNIPREEKIVLYSGHLYDWKGADALLDVARMQPEIRYYLVGGLANEHRDFRERNEVPDNVKLVQHQKPENVPLYLAAADVLVLPNMPINAHSKFATSPIKLFEYMASLRPIVASDMISIRSIVTDKEVVFAEPGDVASWDKKIRYVMSDESFCLNLVKQAKVHSEQFSWNSRAKKIINFLELVN